ncbi:HSP20 family molecular chaperone IbpA [Scopulibacillus daqui]|uniref:HSP20 family molecular chaperone IbpA n=1 Tax=Scopulibacillus daqui TaxID=1469162 RepID=A0ABS2Q2L4_9BACL|nr:Hsp20/alpha crystallin family protein [Scopulibacillus daqui]MBM7646524.1 HSP20 family molecular chaperone IbpA [Scopulibacillus daqui]
MNNFNPWDLFQKEFSKHQNGYGPAGSGTKNGFDLSWIHDLTNNILEQTKAQFNSNFDSNMDRGNQNKAYEPDIFETHNMILTRIAIPEQTNPGDIKVFFDTNKLFIQGIDMGRDLYVNLPANGYAKGSSAVIKDHFLEIKIPKKNTAFSEIRVEIL